VTAPLAPVGVRFARDSAPATATAVATPAARSRARVAVLGAAGYTGQEFIRLALGHPGIELTHLLARDRDGETAAALIAGLDPRSGSGPPVVDPARLPALAEAGAFDTLVTCLPHGGWRELAAQHPLLASAPLRIVDLSSDHRDGAEGYVYGLPEAFRTDLRDAARVANPGCYATAALLALLPAAERGWLAGPVFVTALSGASGAGRSPALRTSFVEIDGGASFYQVGTTHAHVGEIERTLGRIQSAPVAIGFAPQLAPMARGILLSATAPLAEPLAPEAAHAAWTERYADEPFVHVLPGGAWPATRAVRASNRCDVAVTTLHGGRTLLATAALDNLVKGAAGQALQNLNLILGWPEEQGLPVHGSPW
jgi:N-acetyl-gamma-glutamyl-phosphate reductase